MKYKNNINSLIPNSQIVDQLNCQKHIYCDYVMLINFIGGKMEIYSK